MTGKSTSQTDFSDLPAAATGATSPIEFSENVYYVEADMTAKFLGLAEARYPRSMIIIRTNGGLALINPIRVPDEVEEQILALGEIRHVVRIGNHERDVAYYKRRFGATLTGFPQHEYERDQKIDRDIVKDGLPFEVAELLVLDNLPEKYVEANFVLATEKGRVLVTCDSVQNWTNPKCNWIAKMLLPWYGFQGKCIFDKFWVNIMRKEEKVADEVLRSEFYKVLDLDFDNLLSGHGVCTDGTAREPTRQSFYRLFGSA